MAYILNDEMTVKTLIFFYENFYKYVYDGFFKMWNLIAINSYSVFGSRGRERALCEATAED